MTLKIAICDDCEKDRKHMIQLLLRYAFAHECDFHIEEFQNGKELQKKYCTRDTFQIIFIDIEMPDESGIDVADRIKRNVDHDVKVVFVSNYPEYMQDSFKVHPYHFLQKQVTDIEIQKLMNDVLLDMEHNKTLVSIIDGYENEYIVNISDIYYLETIDAKNKELAFHLKDKTIHAKGILSTWSSLLHEHAFHVCSRTVLVNLTHIHFFNGLDVILDNGEKISVSKRNKKILVSQYLNQVVAIKRGGLHT